MTIYDNPKHRDFWNEVMKKHSPTSQIKPKPRKHDEKDLQDSICQYLKVKNIFHWRNNTGVSRVGERFIRYGAVGSPDIFAITKGTLYGIEVKSPTGVQSTGQKHFQKNMEESGAIYILAKSIDDVIGRI